MSSWLRHNLDPQFSPATVFLASSGTMRGDQSVEFSTCNISYRQATLHHVFSRTPHLQGSALFLSLDRHASTAASTNPHHQSDGLVFVQ